MANTDKKETKITEMDINALTHPYILIYNMTEEEFKHYTGQIIKGNIPAMLIHILHNQGVMFHRIKEILKKVEGKKK